MVYIAVSLYTDSSNVISDVQSDIILATSHSDSGSVDISWHNFFLWITLLLTLTAYNSTTIICRYKVTIEHNLLEFLGWKPVSFTYIAPTPRALYLTDITDNLNVTTNIFKKKLKKSFITLSRTHRLAWPSRPWFCHFNWPKHGTLKTV